MSARIVKRRQPLGERVCRVRPRKKPTRVTGKMYRADRHDIHLGLRIGPELDAALELVGEAEGMRPSDFLRRIFDEGLKAWRANPDAWKEEPMLVARGLNITTELRAELLEEAEKARMSQSDFARRMFLEGLKVWRAQRTPKTREGGAN